MSKSKAITKNKKNSAQNYNFRGIDDVYNELQSILAEVGVYSVPHILSERSEERQTKNGGLLIYRVLNIEYTFYAQDGSNVKCDVIGEGMDSGDKASNKAMSVAHKYALLQAFCIPTEDKKDPEHDSPEIAPKQAQKQPEKAPPKQETPTPNIDLAITALEKCADLKAYQKLCDGFEKKYGSNVWEITTGRFGDEEHYGHLFDFYHNLLTQKETR